MAGKKIKICTLCPMPVSGKGELCREHKWQKSQEARAMKPPRTCHLCDALVQEKQKYCAEHRRLKKQQDLRESNERRKRNHAIEKEKQEKAKPGRKPLEGPTQYAERLVETQQDIEDQAYQELRFLAKGLGAPPEEGTANQAMYRRMMGRTAAIGGIA